MARQSGTGQTRSADTPARPDDRRPKIDISLLQTFHLVARTGSFSAASRELNISYQSAANHVRRLEQLYGARLIEAEKGSRHVTLTPQGRALHASLGEELETILSRISVLLHDVRSVLRVGVPQALFHHFFPTILQDFRAQAPDIELAFFERDTTLEKMMMEGALDAAVSERSFGHPAITQHLLGSYRLALVWPADWGIPETETDLAAFRDRPFITYESGQTVRSRALDYLTRQMQAPPRIATTASGSTSVTRLIEAGLGYGVVPEWAAAEDCPKVMRRVLGGMEPMKLWFAHTAFLGNNTYVRALHHCCRKALG
ncbi:LysR family transcriptional regulator [Pontitalea aquivivens]|uniref:LysR family transcriptional regulator n=1 Tax=Pontitalea aquivivens TaxID=3388663 RepID=UPI0039706F59